MANSQAMTATFKQDLLNGLHAFGTTVVRGATTADSFKAALMLASGSLGAGTTSYTSVTASEVTGTGYTAGGVAVTFIAPSNNGTGAFTTPSASIVYSGVTLTTSFDAVLIYNFTASGRNEISVHTFTAQTITAGTLTLTMPTNDATTGLIRLA